jgi:predicted AlkP superfamily phosphohydrolase/phosphomutase
MTRGAAALGVSAVLFAVLGWAHRGEPVGRREVWAFVLLLVAAGSLGAPLAFRGAGIVAPLQARPIDAPAEASRQNGPRVQIIGMDAGSLDFVARAAADGRLPNFGRILDVGAAMHLATIHPTSAETVWAALLTGKLPLQNGVRSSGTYAVEGGGAIELLPNYLFAYELVRLGLLTEQPHTSATLRTRALWNILSTQGVSVGAVGWPLTEPAPVVRGYVVSDRYLKDAESPSGIFDPPGVYPPDIGRTVQLAMEDADAGAATEAPAVPASLAVHQERAQRTDRTYDRIQTTLAAAFMPQVTLTRFQSLDPIGHYFLRFATPGEFGDVPDDDNRRLESVLERHYTLIDDAIGRAIRSLGTDDLLLVVSGFGMEPMSLMRRMVERAIGDPDLNGTHDAAPDGFVLAYGASVARGRPVRGSVVDVTPTILYFLGLPVGRDMAGFVRTDLFQRSFTDQRPITFIPTYDR